MNKLQSPVIEHQDTWLKIVQIAYWLLYVARNEITKIDFEVWQKYLPMNKNIGKSVVEQIKLSLSQVQNQSIDFFVTIRRFDFDKTLFLPQKCKKVRVEFWAPSFYPIVKKTRKVKPIPI